MQLGGGGNLPQHSPTAPIEAGVSVQGVDLDGGGG